MRNPREELSRLALEAAQNPATAPDRVRQMLRELEQVNDGEDRLPAGYLYAGATRLRTRFDAVRPEPLPAPDAPALELWATGNLPNLIRVPFDCICIGVSGSAAIVFGADDIAADWYQVLASSDLRQAFAVGWQVDGHRIWQSDGQDTYILPASTVLGTGRIPRPMAWELKTGQRIAVKVRNMLNVLVDGQVAAPALADIPSVNCEVCFYLTPKE